MSEGLVFNSLNVAKQTDSAKLVQRWLKKISGPKHISHWQASTKYRSYNAESILIVRLKTTWNYVNMVSDQHWPYVQVSFRSTATITAVSSAVFCFWIIKASLSGVPMWIQLFPWETPTSSVRLLEAHIKGELECSSKWTISNDVSVWFHRTMLSPPLIRCGVQQRPGDQTRFANVP